MRVLTLAAAVALPTVMAKTQMGWGFGGSAYQIEGSWNADGKGVSIYDKWFHDGNGLVPNATNNPNGDVAADHYKRYKTDLAYLGQLKATAYRFSISWPRILPNCNGAVNQAGIQYYSDYIDEIIKNGAEPYLTMFHWDTPQACQDRYGGWASDQIIPDFLNYADILFQNFGDRVKYWLPLNEPEANCQFGWGVGMFAPGVVGGDPVHFQCFHRSHLIHAQVKKLALTKYADKAKDWKFGMPSIIAWQEPVTQSAADVHQSNMDLGKYAGWYFDPTVFGDYGAETKNDTWMGKYVPKFTAADTQLLKNSVDFIGLNYYSASSSSASGASLNLATQPTSEPWQTVYPAGLRKIINWLYKRYNIDIVVTEIGWPGVNENTTTLANIVGGTNDAYRRKFWEEHVTNLTAAVEVDKVPVKAFLAWALMDNFEWISYWYRFGCIAVDFNNGTLTRTVKNSTYWLSEYFTSHYDNPYGRTPQVGGGSGGSSGGSGSGGNNKNASTSSAGRGALGVGLMVAGLVIGGVSLL
ncbi:hypothetical protein HDV00_001150 [Rhizophlyctis rosea]|nr:hypothetical protein HDV00_001150 [Rhizophlyctis rosea]